MKLDYPYDYTATFITPISVGKGPLGERIVADLTYRVYAVVPD